MTDQLSSRDHACAHPEQTTAVIYVSCLVATAADLERATQEFRTSRARSGELGEVDDPARAAEIGCLVAAGSEGMNRQVNDELGADGMRHCSTREFHESLARLDVPVLLVHGEQDPRPRWAAERLAETLPRCELVVLPGVGHFPDLEAPERYRGIVRAFLQSVI